MPKDIADLPVLGRAAEVRPDTVDAEARTVDIVWTTGASVRRLRLEGWDIVEYDEELSVDPAHIRWDRINNGAPFLNSHNAWDLDAVLGVVVDGSARIDGGRGVATIRFSEREDVEPIWRDIQSGIIRNVSVGYRVHEFEITRKDGERDKWRAVDWEPMEISAVAIGADAGAQTRSEEQARATNTCVLTRQDDSAAQAAKPKGADMPRNSEAQGGTDEAATTEAQRTAAAGEGTQAQTRSAEQGSGQQPSGEQRTEQRSQPQQPTGPSAEEARSAERQRISTISQLCRRHQLGDQFADDLIERGVTIEDARAAVLDKIAEDDPLEGRTHEPAPAQARGDGQREVAYRDALTNALQHRHNPGAVQLTDAGRDFRGMSLLDMARDALERRGERTRGMSKMELAGAAMQMRAAGYHSTSDFPAILANVANKTLRDAYESTQRTFQAWARRATITDFKPVNRTQLGGAPDLEKVLESGEFKYGTMGESKEVYSLATYGKIISITRQALINDDMDAFTRVPSAFGAAAADLESDIVYAILLNNPTMGDNTALFHADHGNLAGTGTVIDEDALAAAELAFSKQKGLEGRLITVRPRYLIVPTGPRWVEARKQVAATTPNSTDDVNAFTGSYDIVAEPRLVPGSGAAPWFLAGDPNRIDTVEFAYLDGQEGVYTETRQGFEVDGIEIKARHDFAAAPIDHRGLYKNPGANPA